MNIKVFKVLIFYKFKTFKKDLKVFIKANLNRFVKNRQITNLKLLKKASLISLNEWGNRNKNNYKDKKEILIDCMWDNPNYWYRYVLVRNALKLHSSKEYALFGEYSLKIEKLICNILRTFHKD